uniref:Uncharacterized protein n=2 Tax=Lygus hesperus TaxID=30085 RepID=A0A0K8TF39_LYGHE
MTQPVANGTHHLLSSSRLQNGTANIYRRWDNQNGTVRTTYQAQYPPYNLTGFHSNFDSTGNLSYVRARHPINGSRDFRFYTHQFVQPRANGTNSTAKYRTLYYPESNSVDSQGYKGDTSNKGNVRLISVGYYSVNESRDGVRSYYNPPGRGRMGLSESPRTNGFEPSRFRRDTGSWSWLDKLMVSIGLAKLENAKKEMAAGSETVKLEVGDGGNEVLQNQYGYSSNGHHHVVPTQEDHIHVVGSSPTHTTTSPPQTTTSPPQTTTSPPYYAAALIAVETEASGASDYEDVLENSEELQELLPSSVSLPELTSTFKPSTTNDLPKTGPVLIQAPPRFIACEPPLRVARGRCRRVWRSRL